MNIFLVCFKNIYDNLELLCFIIKQSLIFNRFYLTELLRNYELQLNINLKYFFTYSLNALCSIK
jgi:hypothetical protein